MSLAILGQQVGLEHQRSQENTSYALVHNFFQGFP
jgi:hypothetical protein